MTPQQVRESILSDIGEPEGIFHTADDVKLYVQHGEQLMGMLRGFTEKTFSLPLVYNQLLYPLHAAAPDFIFPLRVTILKKQVFPTTLARIADIDTQWAKKVGQPQKFFMVGCTHIGFYPTSPSNTLNAMLTYIAQPVIPADIGSFAVAPEWHEALIYYANAILLAKEQKYDTAGQELQRFMDRVGIPRDVRFGPSETRGTQTSTPLHPSTETPL